MNIQFYNRNTTLTDTLREHIQTKLQKLDWFLNPAAEIQVTLAFSRGLYKVEITAYNSGMMLRAEEQAGDMRAAADDAIDKLSRQIDRHRRRVAKHIPVEARTAEAYHEFEQADDDTGLLVRTKQFTAKPMALEEAIQQMELLGHTFFVYLDVQTRSICVVYRRHDGHYGLLEPEY